MSAELKRSELATVDAPGGPVAASGPARPRLEIARLGGSGANRAPAAGSRRRWLDPAWLSLLATAALLVWGYTFPTEQYITPQTGVGYALGIIGGSAMLLLLVYPARKRVRALKFLGTTKHWFQAHMVLGIVGPVLVLFHSNFSLGATNSNVALACMLVVSGSGLLGRYFYTRIHHGLHGRRANLAELKDYAEKLRWVTSNVEFLPDLVQRIEHEERAIVERCARLPLLTRPPVCAIGAVLARRRLRRYVRQSLRASEPDRRDTGALARPARDGERLHRRPPVRDAPRRRVQLVRTAVLAMARAAPAAVPDAADRGRGARRRGPCLLRRRRDTDATCAPPPRPGGRDAGEPGIAVGAGSRPRDPDHAGQGHERPREARGTVLAVPRSRGPGPAGRPVHGLPQGCRGGRSQPLGIPWAPAGDRQRTMQGVPHGASWSRRRHRAAQPAGIRPCEDRLSTRRRACPGRLRRVPQVRPEFPRGSLRLRRLPQGGRCARRQVRSGLRHLPRDLRLVARAFRSRPDEVRAARRPSRRGLRFLPRRRPLRGNADRLHVVPRPGRRASRHPWPGLRQLPHDSGVEDVEIRSHEGGRLPRSPAPTCRFPARAATRRPT